MADPVAVTPTSLRKKFGRYVRSRSRFRAPLRATLDRLADLSDEVFVFGGLLRDLATGSGPIAPRDVDVVVSGVPSGTLEDAFRGVTRRRTRFGGLVLAVEGWRFDVWDLNDTWAFRTQVVADPSFQTLPLTTFLDVEAITLEYRPRPGKARRLFEHGFFEAVHNRQVELNLASNPFEHLAVVRSMVIASTMGYALGPSLRRFILDHITVETVEQLVEAQWGHYGVVRRHRRTLAGWLRYIEDAEAQANERVVLPPAGGVQLNFWDTLNWDALAVE